MRWVAGYVNARPARDYFVRISFPAEVILRRYCCEPCWMMISRLPCISCAVSIFGGACGSVDRPRWALDPVGLIALPKARVKAMIAHHH